MLPPGGIQAGGAVGARLKEDSQLGAAWWELIQHLTGKGVGAVRGLNVSPSRCI